ncbi:MAG TPA: hypothetical protein VE075_02475 [Thermoanaerobaculia bacterium]|nr:hypothetical protein [Thermoanaerobaculia bacterium]
MIQEPSPPGAHTAWWQPALLGSAWLGVLFGRLLAPGRALANRDILLFHLPLHTCFRSLAAAGALPVWNPWLNGGQPILSNPSYAAFYPPTWLVLPLPPAYALSVLAVLHAAIAFAGAWRLARQLGAGRGAAALAAVGYSGSGAVLSLLDAFNLYCSMAWFPWVLAAGDAALRRPAGRSWRRPALLASLALAMQLLNGEPSMVVVSGLALLAFAIGSPPHPLDPLPSLRGEGDASSPSRPGRFFQPAAWRVLVPPLAAVALAAVQLIPTAGRLAGTARAQGLAPEEATLWSSPPERLVELVFPRFFGDPARQGAGLFFGRGLHDLEYPYVPSIYPGLLVTLLGAAALCRWRVPRRGAWVLCLAAGCFLALGRNNPLYDALRRLLPPLAAMRYPERFILLAVAPLAFAAALGWQRLLDERRAGRAEAADLPLAIGLVMLATAGVLAGVLYLAPGAAWSLLTEHAPLPVTFQALARDVAYLRREAWAAVATAAATSALLALCRWRRPRAGLLSALAVALLAGDLWHYGGGLVRTVPAAEYRREPPLLRQLAPPGSRLFVQTLPEERRLRLARGDADLALSRALLARLLPYSAAIWRVPYALNEDFDRMLTRWGFTTLQVLNADLRRQPEMALRLLGAWGVGGMLLGESTAAGRPEEITPREPPASPVSVPRQIVWNSFHLPWYRFVPRVSFHPGYGSALFVARSQGLAVDRHEHCVRAEQPPATVSYPSPPVLLAFHDAAGRIELRYRTAAGGFFVVAATFDDGWRAAVDGAAERVYLTAAGQMGVALQPGEHRLVLAYRERLLPLGAAVSVAALLAAAWWLGGPLRPARTMRTARGSRGQRGYPSQRGQRGPRPPPGPGPLA